MQFLDPKLLRRGLHNNLRDVCARRERRDTQRQGCEVFRLKQGRTCLWRRWLCTLVEQRRIDLAGTNGRYTNAVRERLSGHGSAKLVQRGLNREMNKVEMRIEGI